MRPDIAVTLREVGADLARPNLADAVIRSAQAVADACARRLWVISYERAERHYWPEEKNKCKQ